MSLVLGPETIAKMHELRAEGLTYQAIADAVYVSRYTVARHLGPAGPHRKQHYETELARRRVQAGLTQQEFAEKVGAALQTVSRWEHRISSPRPYWCPYIAAALGCTPREAAEIIAQNWG